MPIDTSIYANMLRAPRSIADYDNEFVAQQQNALALQQGRMGLRQSENALAMQAQQMEAARRAQDEQGAFRNALSGVDLTQQAGRDAALRANPNLAMPMLKGLAELDDKRTGLAKTEAETLKIRADAITKRIDQHNGLLAQVQSPQMAAQWMTAAYNDPEIGPILQRLGPIEQRIATIPQDQQGLQNWVLQASEGAAKLRERITAEASQAESERANVSREALTKRGQDVSAATAAASRAQSDRHFNATRVDAKAKELATPPKAAAAETQRVTDANDVLEILKQAAPLIDKSTNSYLGVAADEAARTFGKSTGGAQAAAQLKALEGALISKMPKMSGPQSDKDVLLYKQMAGQIGDPTIPADTKKAAMESIKTLNQRYSGAKAAAPAGQVKFLGFE